MINDYNKNGVTKMETRFTYYPNSQMIKDTITGHTYEGNRKICRLLNDLNDAYWEKEELLKKVLKVNDNLNKTINELEEKME